MNRIITLSLFTLAFLSLLRGQNRTDFYTNNKIVNELYLFKNPITQAWDTSYYKSNQLSQQCITLKKSKFLTNSVTNKFYADSQDSIAYLPNGGIDIYFSRFNPATNTLNPSSRQRIRNRTQANEPDTILYQSFSNTTNSYLSTEFAIYYYNKLGRDSFILTRSYINNVLSDTTFILTSKTDAAGNYTHLSSVSYKNGQIQLRQRTSYTYVNKKLITRRDTSDGGATMYFSVRDYSYNTNGQIFSEQSVSNYSNNTTKWYNKTRYIAYNIKNKPLETIVDILTDGVWVETDKNIYTYQNDTLEILRQGYTKLDTHWEEYLRDIHTYCSYTPNAVKTIDKILDIVLSPNPTSGYLNIKFSDNGTEQLPFDLTIFNNSGQLMYQKTNCAASQTLNIEHLKDGFYVAKIVQNGRFKTQKLIILH